MTELDATHDMCERTREYAARTDTPPAIRVQAHALVASLEAQLAGTKADGPYCEECGGRWQHWADCPEAPK